MYNTVIAFDLPTHYDTMHCYIMVEWWNCRTWWWWWLECAIAIEQGGKFRLAVFTCTPVLRPLLGHYY